MCTQVVYSGKPFVIADLRANAAFQDLPYVLGEPQFRSYAGAPVEMEPGITVGALCILDTIPRTLSADDIETLSNFGTVAGGLLRLQRANILLRSEESVLKAAAITDPLTGFFNRGALASTVDAAIPQAMAAGEEIGVLYMDMDGFKGINDRYGHQVGDDILLDFARRVHPLVRRHDCFGRIGGEEFMLIFPETTLPQCRGIVDRVLEKIRTARPLEMAPLFSYTCSAGIAAVEKGDTARSIYSRADAALYDAKHSGRDRIAVSLR